MPQDLETLKRVPAETGITEIIRNRWSPRAYTNKPVASADLTKIFTAASWAASSNGEEPWRFLVGKKGDDTYAKIFESLGEFNQTWAQSAPILILTLSKKTFTKNGEPNYHALHDVGAASATMCLEAIALGIHTHGMAGFDHDKARALFEIPDDFIIGAVWAMGYLGDPETLPDYMKKTELAPRHRKPISEFVFAHIGEPAKL